MKKLFIETTGFTRRMTARLDDQAYAAFQKQLLENPDAGNVIPGCGGLRKVRLPDPRRRKGKRGGYRVIYLHVPEADCILLLDLYEKDEKDDLAPQEKQVLRKLVREFKAAATQTTRRSTKGNRRE